jgi:hypothetical protein
LTRLRNCYIGVDASLESHDENQQRATSGPYNRVAVATRRFPDPEPDQPADPRGPERLGEVRARQPQGIGGALAMLDAISSRMPDVDAVLIVREGRTDLDRRSVGSRRRAS